MISFSYRSFQDYLKSNLEKSEIRFIVRTFGYGSLYFLLFGVLLSLVYTALDRLLPHSLENWAIYGGSMFLGIIVTFPLCYFSIKYRNNPLRVPNSFVVAIFTLLTLSFLFLFLGVVGVVAILAAENTFAVQKFVLISIASVFGLSFFIYLIPASYALFVAKRKTVITVSKFLNRIYMINALLLIIFLICIFVSQQISSVLYGSAIVLSTLALFLSPVLTVYRLKTVAQFINYEDPYERKRWENYFSFEIAFQLLQLALHIMRLFAWFLFRQSASRLR